MQKLIPRGYTNANAAYHNHVNHVLIVNRHAFN